jgi:hypothetical protein
MKNMYSSTEKYTTLLNFLLDIRCKRKWNITPAGSNRRNNSRIPIIIELACSWGFLKCRENRARPAELPSVLSIITTNKSPPAQMDNRFTNSREALRLTPRWRTIMNMIVKMKKYTMKLSIDRSINVPINAITPNIASQIIFPLKKLSKGMTRSKGVISPRRVMSEMNILGSRGKGDINSAVLLLMNRNAPR